jgi:hypothetical protein
MAEQALYKALSDYNSQISNTYNKNWGSLFEFMGNLPLLSSFVLRLPRHEYLDDQN